MLCYMYLYCMCYSLKGQYHKKNGPVFLLGNVKDSKTRHLIFYVKIVLFCTFLHC